MKAIRMAYCIAFVASFSVMVLELVAGRIIAPYLGVSIYTWTSVIGVILTGMALGNFAGAWLSKRPDAPRALSAALLGSGFVTAAGLVFVRTLGEMADAGPVPLLPSTLGISFAGFFLPALLLSLVTPLLIKISVRDVGESGAVAGRIYGVGAAGSIIGTFLTGFVFLPRFGSNAIVLAVAAILVVFSFVSFFYFRKSREHIPGSHKIIVLFMLFGFAGLLPLAGKAPCDRESLYYCIRLVRDRIAENLTLRLDHLEHSHIYPQAPHNLGDGYQEAFRLLADYERKKYGASPDALFLGGGGYVLPHLLAVSLPHAKLHVVEIDPAVTETMEGVFGAFPFGITHGDARVFINTLAKDVFYDIVIGDAFQDLSVPYQLTTEEFLRGLAAHLRPHGAYAVNIVDSYENGSFLASMIRTFREVFPDVKLFAEEKSWKNRGRDTYVLAGFKGRFDETLWNELKRSVPEKYRDSVTVIPDEEIFELAGRKGITLTDDFAPVENMLANIFAQSYLEF